jgi:hypothetical protein
MLSSFLILMQIGITMPRYLRTAGLTGLARVLRLLYLPAITLILDDVQLFNFIVKTG